MCLLLVHSRLDVHFSVIWECIKNLLWVFICLWKYAHRVSPSIWSILEWKGDKRPPRNRFHSKTMNIWYISKWHIDSKMVSNSFVEKHKDILLIANIRWIFHISKLILPFALRMHSCMRAIFWWIKQNDRKYDMQYYPCYYGCDSIQRFGIQWNVLLRLRNAFVLYHTLFGYVCLISVPFFPGHNIK